MNKKLKAIVLVFASILALFGIFALGIAYGGLDEVIFEQIPYNYTSYVSLPANTPESGSLGGYYNITGKGKDFKFFIKIPNAEESESPLDYTPDGLNGTGHLENIHITMDTLMALYNKDLKSAMFNTEFNGTYNMSCAAWVGSGNFSNNGKLFNGSFEIIGQITYWKGTFNLTQEDTRIAMDSEFYLHPVAEKNPKNVRTVEKTFYI
ncbi:MAG: hypothetical protein U1C19_09000 [Methanobacteriaceae archaeon]|nr:hypothetical protein [Methanobacteriaceae archaeon]